MKGMIGGLDARSWMAIAILTLSAVAWPSAARAADCQFDIRATNDLSGDVWFDLYDSFVRTQMLLGVKTVQLKIQNHRLGPGQSLNRRYTANGKCENNRAWLITYRVPVAGKGLVKGDHIVRTTGSSSTSRTVDLGRTSKLPTN